MSMFRRRGPYLSPIRMMQIGVDAFRQPPPPAFVLVHFDNGANWDDAPITDEYGGVVQLWPRETKIATDQSVFGGASGRFRGAFLTSPDSEDWNFGAGNFTVEAWIRFEAGFLPAANNERVVFGQWESGNVYGWLFQAETSAMRFYWRIGGSQFNVGGTVIWASDTWYHITATRSGDTFRLYVNGLLVGTTTQAGTINNSNELLCISANRDRGFGGVAQPFANARPLYGWMDELSIWKGVAKYTASNPGGLPNLWGASNNAQIDTSKSMFGGASLMLPQIGDQIRCAGGAHFDFGTGDFTIEAWVWITDHAVSHAIFGHWTASNKFLLYVENTGTLRWAPSFVQTSGFTVGTGAWHHVAACKVGGYLRLFIDGVIGFAGNDTTNVTATTIMEVGNAGTPSGTPYWIDDLRVTKGVARYKADVFQVPTAEYDNTDPDYANVQALLHFNGTDGDTVFPDDIGHIFTALGNAQIDNAQAQFGGTSLGNFSAGTDCAVLRHNLWTPTGNAQIDTAQFKYGSASALFDGTGDLISTPDVQYLRFGNGDFTIEFWVRFNTVTGSHSVLGKRNSAGWSAYLVYQIGTSLQFYASSNGSSWDVANGVTIGTVATGQWYHVAVTRSGNTFQTWLDGVQGASFSSSATLVNDANAPLCIGANATAGEGFSGWIDEVRLTKGLARYTSGFTPPSGAFPDDEIGDPDFAKVVALLHFEGADASNVFTDQISDNGDFNIPINTPFTLEAWCRWNSVSGNQYICGKIKTGNDVNDDNHTEWLFHVVNSTTLRLYYGHRGVNQTLLDFPFPTITANVWHHVALFRDGSNRIGCTVDGILSSKTYVDGKQLVHVGKPLTIGGSDSTSFAGSFNGWIDELRFTPGVCRYPTVAFTPPASAHPDDVMGDPDFASVSALLHLDGADGSKVFTDQVTQFAFTPPSAAYDNTDPDFANCKLLMHFDGSDGDTTFTDEIGHVITSHRENNIARTDQKKFGVASYHLCGFSRACGAVFQDDPKLFRFSGGDFTIEFWWQNYSSNALVSGDIMSKRAGAANTFGPFAITGGGYFSARRLFLFMSSTGTSWNLVNGLLFLSNFGGWAYVSLSRQGPNLYVHVNGVLAATVALGSAVLYDNPGVPFVIGNCADGSSPGTGSTIDELRISKGVGWYGAANYTVPSAPWPNP